MGAGNKVTPVGDIRRESLLNRTSLSTEAYHVPQSKVFSIVYLNTMANNTNNDSKDKMEGEHILLDSSSTC